MDTTEELLNVNRRISLLESSDFREWKAEFLDTKRQKYLTEAILEAKKMTPEANYRASLLLNLYAEIGEMTTGALMRAEANKEYLEEQRN